MKAITILFPTDFSIRANNGLTQVAHISSRIGAKLIIYHAYPRPYSESGSKEHVDKMLLQMEREIERKFKAYPNQIAALKEIECEFVKELGLFTEGLINRSRRKEVDMVAMPTKGAKGLGMIWGTKTGTVVKSIDKPILVIPDNTDLINISKVGLVCDYSNQTGYHPLDFMHDLIAALDLHVDTVTLNKSEREMTPEEKGYQQVVSKKLKEVSKSFSFTSHSYVDNGIIDYARENEIGLITILPKEYSFLESIFHESFTEQMTFQSPLPLLILK